MKSASFNIVILPPDEIAQKAISISKLFQNKKALFTLNDKNHFAHITLYMVELPLKNVPEVITELKKIASETRSLELTKDKYRQSFRGYLDVGFKKTHEVSALQKTIIEKINPFREGLLKPSDQGMMSGMDKAELNNLKNYGSGFIFDQWTPHITFTKLEDTDKTAFENIKEEDFSFTVDKIGLFYLGDYGTCREKVAQFDLKD